MQFENERIVLRLRPVPPPSPSPPPTPLSFLSATSENTREFGEWVGRAKDKTVHIVETKFRPVPLQHNLYMRNGLFPVLEGRNPFSDATYNKAVEFLNPKKAKDNDKDKRGGGGGGGGGGGYVRPGGPPSWQNSGSKSQVRAKTAAAGRLSRF